MVSLDVHLVKTYYF